MLNFCIWQTRAYLVLRLSPLYQVQSSLVSIISCWWSIPKPTIMDLTVLFLMDMRLNYQITLLHSTICSLCLCNYGMSNNCFLFFVWSEHIFLGKPVLFTNKGKEISLWASCEMYYLWETCTVLHGFHTVCWSKCQISFRQNLSTKYHC